MSRGPRTAHRKDGNHDRIVAAFKVCGCDVLSLTEVGGGAPDLLVHWRGRLALIEVKAEGGKLRPDQKLFAARWPVAVVRSLEDVDIVMKVLATKGVNSCS